MKSTGKPCPIYRVNKQFFLETPAPLPFKGWNVEAFQTHCREEMIEAGFNLNAPIKCVYDPGKGDVVFWQEAEDAEPAVNYSLN